MLYSLSFICIKKRAIYRLQRAVYIYIYVCVYIHLCVCVCTRLCKCTVNGVHSASLSRRPRCCIYLHLRRMRNLLKHVWEELPGCCVYSSGSPKRVPFHYAWKAELASTPSPFPHDIIHRWKGVGGIYMPQCMNVSPRSLFLPFRSVFDFGRRLTRLEITQNKERESALFYERNGSVPSNQLSAS